MKPAAAAAGRGGLGELARSPLVAFEFLTVLRLRVPPLVADAVLGASQAWFPLAGLLIGAAAYGVNRLAAGAVSPGLNGWLTVALMTVLTGAFHLDGLADSADGLFGGRTAAQRLSIMKDSAVGAYGVCAIVLVLGLKATAIGSLAGAFRLEGLLLAPCLGRWSAVVAIAAFPYARASGLGQAFHAHSFPLAAPLAGACALWASVLLAGWPGLGLFAAAAVLALAVGAFVSERIDGLTGDSYGAIIEIGEGAALIAFVALGAS